MHRRQVLGLPRHRGAAARRSTRASRWSPTRSSSCAMQDLAVFFDAEHFFDGYKRNPEFALRVLEAAAEHGATRLVLCDTNGGSLPHEVERDRPRGRRATSRRRPGRQRRRRRRRAPPRRRRHRRRERAGRCARWRGAGAGDDQRVRRAHGQLQPHHDHPEPDAEDGHRDDPGGPARPADAGRAPRRRAREHGAEPAGAVRRRVGVRAQGGAARERDREAIRRVRARRRPTPSATARGSSSPSSRGSRRSCSRPRSSGSSSTGRR